LSAAAKEEKKPSWWQKLKTLYAEYGVPFVVYYGTAFWGGFAVVFYTMQVRALVLLSLLLLLPSRYFLLPTTYCYLLTHSLTFSSALQAQEVDSLKLLQYVTAPPLQLLLLLLLRPLLRLPRDHHRYHHNHR